MNFILFMLAAFPVLLIAAAILLCRLPDETGDLQRIAGVRARQAAREAGEQG